MFGKKVEEFVFYEPKVPKKLMQIIKKESK